MRDPGWYKQAIIYELPVKSFHDSNGDGIGDFPGLIEKLDYIESLGVTCLWLLPFFPSPLRDDGYDIADYCGIHPSYGTLEDFKQFLDAAHARRLHVVIEFVLNHTSEAARVVSSRTRCGARLPRARLLRLERQRREVPRRADHLRRQRAIELDVGCGRQRLLLAPVLPPPAGPQLRQSGGARRSC